MTAGEGREDSIRIEQSHTPHKEEDAFIKGGTVIKQDNFLAQNDILFIRIYMLLLLNMFGLLSVIPIAHLLRPAASSPWERGPLECSFLLPSALGTERRRSGQL